jgi:hypothetical protein
LSQEIILATSVHRCSLRFSSIPLYSLLARRQFFLESIFRHHQVGIELFVARVLLFTVIAGDDASADWKQLKEQLCNCGDANVAAFLSNYRRSNAVMQLSLLNLALLRPLRAFVTPNSLFSTIQFIPSTCRQSLSLTFEFTGFAENLNQHSEQINQKLEQEFEDWDFFANDFDNRVRHVYCPFAFVYNLSSNTNFAA